MRKYFNILKAELMTNIQYTLNIILGSIGFLMFVFTFYFIWQYIYSDPNELINGYSMSQMIWYLAITEIIFTSTKSSRIVKDVSKDVKTGSVAYNINKPYSYVLYVLFKELGKCIFTMLLYFAIGLLVVSALAKGFPIISPHEILLVIISCILAQIIVIFIAIFIGLFSFYIEDSSPFYWMYSKFTILLGIIFPIEFFPEIMQKVLVFTPVYVTAYGPAKLFVDFSYSNFYTIIVAQLIYIAISYAVCMTLFACSVKRLNVNGG
ncbi:MAG: ABC-2 family transporter protein [Clostridia bacterium]|nr:ABC-2 family transporter protein [Clostridia bacterium]